MEDIFQRIADELPKTEDAIRRAEDALKALREVGEPNEKLEERLRELKARKNRWVTMLATRGVVVGESA